MNASQWTLIAAALALAGCSQSTETSSTQKAVLTAKDMTAQIDALAKMVDPAPLPAGDYAMSCVGNKRARVLGIEPNMKEGWPTAKTVVLAKSSGGSATCPDLGLVSDKDELTIDGMPPNFTMHFKHNGVVLDRPLNAAPNIPSTLLPMWFQTPTFDTNGIQYFVYMLDHPSASGILKDQIYMLEAFSKSAPPACLDERPVYGTNVIPISNPDDCKGAYHQNGTGTGAEPK
jgi:hypothetical protein